MRLGWGAARSAWQGIFKIMWPGFRFNCLMTVLDCPLANLTALVVLQFLSELPLSDSAVACVLPFSNALPHLCPSTAAAHAFVVATVGMSQTLLDLASSIAGCFISPVTW